MEAQCVKFRLKPGHGEALVNWITRLDDRSTELQEAMTAVGLVAEAVFLERSGSGDHILIYTSGRDLRAGLEALSQARLPLVQEFNQLLASSVEIERAVSLQLIYHSP